MQQRLSARGLLAVAMGLGVAAVPGGVVAQEQQERRAQTLDEIVVTARLREETLQDVPIAVTAISGQEIRDLQMRNAGDLAAFTPGFSFESYLGRDEDRPVVRGMSNILGVPNAAFFIDGVFVPGSVAGTELRNLERVEVIKGPQAALYGRATFAGAINYITRDPTNEFEGELSLTGAQHDEYELVLSHSGPLIEDRLFYYVAARHYEYGGEYRNQLTNEMVGDEETRSFTAKLQWLPNDRFDATLRMTYAEDRDGHPALFLQGQEFNNCFLRDPENAPAARGYYCGEAIFSDQVNLRTDVFPDGAGYRRDVLRSALTMNLALGDGFQVTSITSYQDEDFERRLDASYGGYDPLSYLWALLPVPDQRGSFWREQSESRYTFSQELRIASPGDRRFRWLAGTYYFNDKFNLSQNDKYNPLTIIEAQIDPEQAVLQRNAITSTTITENIAGFGSVEFDFDDRWTATAELRYAMDRLSFDPVSIAGDPVAFQNDKFYSLTPRVTLTYRHSDDLTLYGNIARGNKPGGFNDPAAFRQTYDEETSTNYEVGFKSQLWDGRARWEVAAFFIDWEDQQLTLTFERPDGTLDSLIDNVGETRVMGIETEFSVLLTDNWNLGLSYSFIDSEIREYISQDQADLLGCTPTAGDTAYFACVQERGSVAGNQTPRSPRHQAALRSRYSVPMAEGYEWFVGGNITFQSSRYSQVHNLIKTGEQLRVGLRTGFESDRWDVSFWAKNLFNQRNVVEVLRYIDTSAWAAQPPAPCPPVPGVFREGLNCGPYFAQQQWGASTPRGFANTLSRGRQFGVTANVRF